MNDKTYIKYNKVTSRGESYFKPEIVAKRNDPRVNRHQQIQLQGSRANCDIQLIIDHHACIEYLAKYASKAEKLSSIARDAFVSVISNIQENSTPQNLIRKLMIKSVGERDMGMQEVMHQILGLKLYRSSFQVINISLDNSKRCNLSRNNIKVDESDLERYANRLKHGQKFKSMNLVEYFSKYQVKSTKLPQRKKPVLVRTFPQYSSNPNSETYGLHCKFQLIKYKPWNTCPQDAWNHSNDSDIAYVKEWKNFLETDIGNKLVPNWKTSLDDAFKFVSPDELREDKETVSESQQCEEWMHIARMVGRLQGNHLVGILKLRYKK